METQYRAVLPFCVLFSVAENIFLLRREGRLKFLDVEQCGMTLTMGKKVFI